MTRGIPRETQAFIRRYISSIHQLETLLWMRDHPERSVSPDEFAKEERLDIGLARDLLNTWRRAGFLVGSDQEGYRYGPPPDLQAQVGRLAEVYATYRVAVINLVFSMPSESVQSFADAFRIRKEDDDS